jgi:hypothetical protein
VASRRTAEDYAQAESERERKPGRPSRDVWSRLCRPRRGAQRPLPGEHADDLVADRLGVGVEVEQDPRGDALVLADEAEQDVFARGVNGIWPVVTSSPWPTIRATCARTSSTVMSRDSSTRAASPSSSRSSPSRKCSVPM